MKQILINETIDKIDLVAKQLQKTKREINYISCTLYLGSSYWETYLKKIQGQLKYSISTQVGQFLCVKYQPTVLHQETHAMVRDLKKL